MQQAGDSSIADMKSIPRLGVCLGLALLLAACAGTPSSPPPAAPLARWSSPLPHGGDPAILKDWWSRFDDPLLPRLVQQAQAGSPVLAQALARIDQARALARSARAAQWPGVSANASATDAHDPIAGDTRQAGAGLSVAWEIDLFGARRAAASAAEQRVQGSRLQWHDARVSLAAEVANTYVGLRACEALAAVYAQEAQSQATTAKLTREKVRAGFEAPSNGSLADAGAADAANRLAGQRAECAVVVQALVSLTGQPAQTLLPQLQTATAKLPQPAVLAVPEVPAQVLGQRPDLAAAQRELAAAAADIRGARAERFPVLNLSGSIMAVVARVAGAAVHGSTWSIAPLASLPLFDAGRRAANVDLASARYDEARALYEQRARQAVREVEEALIRLDAAARREADAQRAADGYRAFFAAAESRWRIGAGSLLEMEEARRLSLSSQAALLAVKRDRVGAWIALYRATGGGWEAEKGSIQALNRPEQELSPGGKQKKRN